jgi:hypothetical protein
MHFVLFRNEEKKNYNERGKLHHLLSFRDKRVNERVRNRMQKEVSQREQRRKNMTQSVEQRKWNCIKIKYQKRASMKTMLVSVKLYESLLSHSIARWVLSTTMRVMANIMIEWNCLEIVDWVKWYDFCNKHYSLSHSHAYTFTHCSILF